MAARRRRPDGPTGWSASLVAWFVFALGAVAFGRAMFQSTRSFEPAAAVPVVAAPGRASEHFPADDAAAAAAPARRPVDLLAGRDGGRRVPPRRVPPRGSARLARIAIIIDDIGQDRRAFERAARIEQPLTFAVIPHLRHSRAAAEYLNGRGFEIMLHLPMEPLDYPGKDPGPGAVLTRMSPAEIRRAVDAGLRAVPHVRGVNNHMGSRITADRSRIRVVLESLRGRPLFFIDSRTTSTSVAYAVARELRIPAAQRAVFLDHEIEAGHIRRELRRAVELARQRGSAIAIGHPYPVTLDVLSKELPRLGGEVDLVFASELAG